MEIEKIINSIDIPRKTEREFLITISPEEFLSLPNKYRTTKIGKPYQNIGGNISSYNYKGTTVHFKIDIDLK